MEQAEPNMAEHHISLVDGAAIVVLEEEWPALANSSHGTLRGGAYLIARLAVRRHQDGRTLVHLEEQLGGKSKDVGVLLTHATLAGVQQATHALVERQELPATLAEECVAMLVSRGDASFHRE
jgi:hypothetical protein